jgi:glycosyltransferase involved in cell wall biosynthesis
MSNRQFSVVIPVRNGENYIRSTLESVLNQTYQNFNIQILENCSEDKTVEIINAYHDPRIQIFPAAAPLSIEDNWLRILDLELSEFMTLLSHDDLLYPEYLQEIADLILAEPNASLYSTHFHLINSEGAIIRACQPIPYKETANDFLTNVHLSRREFCGSGFVARSADYKYIGGFPSLPGLLFADAMCWYRLAHLAYKVSSPKYLYAFRLHSQSASHSSNLVEFYKACQEYLSTISDSDYGALAQNRNLAHRYVKRFFNYRHHRVLLSLISSPVSQRLVDYQSAKKQLRDIAGDDPLFAIADLEARIFEFVTRLHNPLLRLPLRVMVKVFYKFQMKTLYLRMKFRLLFSQLA